MGKIVEKTDNKPVVYKSFQDIPSSEQRYFPRWEISNRAYYCAENDARILKSQTKNLSPSGVSLEVYPDIGLNQKIEVKIYLNDEKSFQATGKVVWKYLFRDEICYAGILFDPLPEETLTLISAYAFTPQKRSRMEQS
jgi:hypothetical protein